MKTALPIIYRMSVATVGCCGIICALLYAPALAAEKPIDTGVLAVQAKTALAQGDVAQAMQKYREIIKEKPGDLPSLKALASLEEKVGNSRNAEQLRATICTMEPASLEAAVHLGFAALKNDNLAAAFDAFQRVVDTTGLLDPHRAEAEQGLNQIMARSPYYRSKILAARGRLLQQQIDIETRQQEIGMLSRQAGVYQAMLEQGRQLFREKRYQEAMYAYDMVLRLRPADPEAYRLRQAADMALQREADNAITDAAINNLMSPQRP